MSVPFSVADVARWSGARLVQGGSAAVFTGASIDTRTCTPGALFVAIRGEKHDAHAFLADALARGATGLLVEKERRPPSAVPAQVPVLEVADTTAALGAIGAGHRAAFEGPVVAITGSNGKTTTKEMTAAILSMRAPCLRTPGNWNNQFGVPLTLLLREPEHRTLVVELGMNHRGEIAPLVALARPTVGLVTNVGTAHVENLGTQEEIALEKGDLFAGLDATATAVVNADDPLVRAQSARTRARLVTFGRHAAADVHADDVAALEAGGFAFALVTPSGARRVRVHGIGETTVINAVAASAAALAAGASLDEVVAGLDHYRNIGGRMEQMALPGSVTVINDTYNANPQSMDAALRSLAERKGRGRGIAVLGDMGELGDTAPSAHRAAGALVAALGIDLLFAVGRFAAETAAGARDSGMDAARIHVSDRHEETSARLLGLLRKGDWVLAKGSRSARMERVVEALVAGLRED